MKKIVLFSILFTGFPVTAQQFQLISQDDKRIVIDYMFKQEAFQHVAIDGQQYVDFGKTHKVLSMEKGAPALPLFHTSVQLPASGNTVVVVEYDQVTEIQQVTIAPSKGNLKRNTDPSTIPYTFGSAYYQDAFYPSNVVAVNDPFIWRTTRGQTITVSPYQYNPVTKVLRIHENLRIRVINQPSIKGLNEISPAQPDRVAGKAQNSFFINTVTEKYAPLEEEGEMLVIMAPQYMEEMTPFIHWKNEKGIRTTAITTAEMGTTDATIKAYIQNYYTSHPDLIYILLVGDHAEIPAHTYGISDGEDLWSDSYYGQLAGGANDLYPEAFVGRFSGNEAQITTMVNRTLEYEKNPAPGNWMEKAIGLASNQGGGIGDEGQADWQHMRGIRTRLMDYGYTSVYEFYDGSHAGEDASGNPTSASIAAAVNEGIGLFNYTGHGSQNACVTGNFSSTHVNAAVNNGFYPMVVSVACNNGTFTEGTCFSEAWLRADNNSSPAGAIGVMGSSILMAWAQPMQTQDEIAEIIALAYPDNIKTTTGGLFYNSQISMLEQYPGTDGKEVMETWIFFGDPSTQFRNKQTMPLTVEQPADLEVEASGITVSCSVEGAFVAVSQDHKLIGKGIASGGIATIALDSFIAGVPLTVVATKQNYAAAIATINVSNSSEKTDAIVLYPNPAVSELMIKGPETIESVELYTLQGQWVASYKAVEGELFKMNLSTIASGAYLVQIVTSGSKHIKRIEVIH